MKLIVTAIAAGLAVSLATFSLASPGAYYLYAPRQAAPDEASGVEAGVLVQEITIRRGDTLRAISRAHSGRASYFPQILLFNEIRNPDLIYEGRTLRVPVRKAGEKSESQKPRLTAKRKKQRQQATQQRSLVPAEKTVRKEGGRAGESNVRETREQALFAQAAEKYHSGACRDALPLLEEFLVKFPGSRHVPDVRLFRADCHLKLSQE